MSDGGGVLGFMIWGGLLCGSSVYGSWMVMVVGYFVFPLVGVWWGEVSWMRVFWFVGWVGFHEGRASFEKGSAR